MSDLIQKYNLGVIKWLNNSYDSRKTGSNFLWAIQPWVLIRVVIRLFFIFCKAVLKFWHKIFPIKEVSALNTEGIIHFRVGYKTSFINILLYREQKVIYNKDFYLPSKQLSKDQIKKHVFSFRKTDQPLVSIIIPIYNKVEYTFNCLISLQKNINPALSYEIILVNDNSSDESSSILGKIEGVTLVENRENIGFILSCMKGADKARGNYLCFLNNDTEVLPKWLESLVETFKTYPDAGLVGSMLIYPDNRLQEAGGVIWSDASGWNYGRLQNFIDPRYNFVRPVDYCSGASILIRKDDFEKLGGFEKDFVPAYYEDTDLCFAVRHKLKKQVLYQPSSKLLHHEGVSAGTSTSTGMKRFQAINAEKFKIKWTKELQNHSSNDAKNASQASLRFCGSKTIMVLDSNVPLFDKDSGSYRLFHLLKIFKQLGYHVIFVPNDEQPQEPYTNVLQQLGIEVLYFTKNYKVPIITQIKERLHYIDFVWVCRPHVAEKFMKLFKSNKNCKLIYDTIDLHYVRMKRELELYPSRKDINWQSMQLLELEIAKTADINIAITDTDKEQLTSQGIQNVETIPNIHVAYSKENLSFESRKGILFIGSYDHKPNVDAVVWLCKEIMPIVWAKYPNIVVTLLGNKPTETVLNLSGPNVIVTGFIEDVSPYFLSNRIFVAPLNYGSGMKGKIGQSLEYSLPLLSTSIGAEGMNLKSDRDCIIAEDTESFAKEILRLYSDKTLWEFIASNCHEAIKPYSPAFVKEKISKILSSL